MSKTKGSLKQPSPSEEQGQPASHKAGKFSRARRPTLVFDKKTRGKTRGQVFFWVVVLAAIVVLVVRNIDVFGNVLKVAIGFGAVILVHEFGHFLIAKLSGIKVEAFSIFMPPTLLGVRKTKNGLRVRFLPKLSGKETGRSNEGQLSSAGDSSVQILPEHEKTVEDDGTEYCIGLIPFGGFVKMLGQDDIGPVKANDDPRSFANKPVGTRMGVITAGVVFNAISAIAVFMIVFLIGIKLPPPVVGEVIPDSPAARAGLKPGDEIIEIAGKSKNLDFSNIGIAAALSDVNEVVPLKVRHEDGTVEDYAIAAEAGLLPGMALKAFGILQPTSLTIARVSDPNKLEFKTRLLPGDRIKAVDGKEVQSFCELSTIVENTLAPEVVLLAERTDDTGKLKLVESRIALELASEDTGHIYSMVPRLRMENIERRKPPWMKITAKARQLLAKAGIIEQVKAKPFLQSGDIILSIGEATCPTPEEFRATVKGYEDKDLPVEVLRTNANGVEETLTINVRPTRQTRLREALHRSETDVNEVAIGISFIRMYDVEHPVVAKTISTERTPKLEIPRGAIITAVDGAGVSNFYDVIREIQKHPGERITIDWRLDEETAGDAALNVDTDKDSITVKSTFAELVPFERLERLYKASGPIDAIGMGCRKTTMFITQTYITLKRLIGGLVSPKNLMGPVGIIALSYRVVSDQPLIYYLYLLGLISAVIAVFNFLPLPPLDGGMILLLLVEKIKGSALSERIQGVIAYSGWVLIGGLFLYVTFNDIVRVFFG